MSWVMLGIICVLLIGSAYRCLRRVLLEEARQRLYRIREGIYDRVIAGELSLEDPSVAALVHYLHGFIWFLAHWSPLMHLCAVAVARWRKERVVVPWLADERVKKEAWLALQATVVALRAAWLPLRLKVRVTEVPAKWMEKTPGALMEELQLEHEAALDRARDAYRATTLEREAALDRAREAYEATTCMVARVKARGLVPAVGV